jgi:hypothetical protein
MAWTKATYLLRMREWMDAVGSERWSDAYLYAMLGMKFRDEWQGVLDAAPYYRFAQRTPTTDSAGQFSYADLSDPSTGDAQQNVFKLLVLTDGNATVYRETDFSNVPLATAGTMNYLDFDRRYYLIGDTVQVLPAGGGLSLVASINWYPTPIDQLSGDDVDADFPAGFENLVALAAGADALAIGGAETGATADLRALALTYRQNLYADVARRTGNPLVLAFPDAAWNWGG